MKFLIVIDMQNDFIDGTLANPAAEKIVKPIADYIENFDGHIILTQDSHNPDYLKTQEGRKLPVEHCIKYTEGWKVNTEIKEAIKKHNKKFPKTESRYLMKETFGAAADLYDMMEEISLGINSQNLGNCTMLSMANACKKFNQESFDVESVEFVGTVTEICVISNVLGLKAYFPDTDFIVHSNMCAGLNDEGHNAAITVMKSCQVDVK